MKQTVVFNSSGGYWGLQIGEYAGLEERVLCKQVQVLPEVICKPGSTKTFYFDHHLILWFWRHLETTQEM
jgi:hypothetical protein